MKPGYWIIVIALGAGAVIAWQWPRQPAVARSPDLASPAAVASPAVAPPAGSRPVAIGPSAPTPEQVRHWVQDVSSADPAKRAVAINALSQAPRALALPVLQNVVMNGEPATDRPLALNALRELALGQGDADGGIRQAIREVIYHGDDEKLMADAQDALDVVEESELK
jgi:hypothetical protein